MRLPRTRICPRTHARLAHCANSAYPWYRIPRDRTAYAPGVHAMKPHPSQIQVAEYIFSFLPEAGATRPVLPDAGDFAEQPVQLPYRLQAPYSVRCATRSICSYGSLRCSASWWSQHVIATGWTGWAPPWDGCTPRSAATARPFQRTGHSMPRLPRWRRRSE